MEPFWAYDKPGKEMILLNIILWKFGMEFFEALEVDWHDALSSCNSSIRSV